MVSAQSLVLLVVVVVTSCFVHPALTFVPIHERTGVSSDRTRPFRPASVEEHPSAHRPRPPSHPSRVTPNAAPQQTTGSAAAPSVIPGLLSSFIRRVAALETRMSTNDVNFRRTNARIASLVSQVFNLQQEVRELSEAPARYAPQPMAELRSANSDLETRLSRLEADNQELRGFLVSFERFFKRLSSQDPATFDPDAAPAERMSRLHQYLGNAEAELMNLNPPTLDAQSADESDDIPVISGFDDLPPVRPAEQAGAFHVTSARNDSFPGPSVRINGEGKSSTSSKVSPDRDGGTASRIATPNRGRTPMSVQTDGAVESDDDGGVRLSTAEADRLAAALEQLNAQNSELTARLQALEAEGAETAGVGVQSMGTMGTASHITTSTTNNEITQELLDKVDLLGQVVAIHTSTILGETPVTADRVGTANRGGKVRPVGQSGATSAGTLNQEDAEIMKEALEDVRSKGSSRKCAFSVARTTPLLGSDVPQNVEFDHVFVNKGRDFTAHNSSFVCERAGYYFINFNLRSYDDHFLGVTLMKNSDVITAVYTDADARNVMESQSVIVHMEEGDVLYLRLGPSPRFGIHSNTYKYVTFSGFLIYSGY